MILHVWNTSPTDLLALLSWQVNLVNCIRFINTREVANPPSILAPDPFPPFSIHFVANVRGKAKRMTSLNGNTSKY